MHPTQKLQFTPFFRRIFCGTTLLASLAFNHLANANEDDFMLMLAGGAVHTCSSMAKKNCLSEANFSAAKSALLYEISPDAHQRLKNTSAYLSLETALAQKLNAALEHIYADQAVQRLDRRTFTDRIDASADSRLVSQLPDALYYALLDTHESVQTGSDGTSLKEIARLDWTENPFSRDIYTRFVARAATLTKKDKPRILVVTASARDPFEAADFYESIFTSSGAEVIWLPLSPAMSQAMYFSALGLGGCDKMAYWREQHQLFDRERIYPERTALQTRFCHKPDELIALLESAQGIFFNGGDQSKTLASLLLPTQQPSAFFQRLKARVAERQLIVGGTSAGTAVQAGGLYQGNPVPMFSSGDPEYAMRKGVSFVEAPSERGSDGRITLRGSGGTGLFHYGLLDTHFSERDRESRLIMAALFSQQRFGFGVDENTALLVNPIDDSSAHFEVIGEQGVFVVDLTDGQWQQSQQSTGVSRQLGGMAHYWASGSKARLSSAGWQVTLSGETSTKARPAEQQRDGRWRNEAGYKCGTQQRIAWQQFEQLFVLQASPQTEFSFNKRKQCSYQALPFVMALTQ